MAWILNVNGIGNKCKSQKATFGIYYDKLISIYFILPELVLAHYKLIN